MWALLRYIGCDSAPCTADQSFVANLVSPPAFLVHLRLKREKQKTKKFIPN